MALRSFFGSCATLITSVVNLSILMALEGEPGWICLMCCNADILFCVVVLHWVTSKEQKQEDTAFRSSVKPNSNPLVTIGSHATRSRRMSASVDKEKAPVDITLTRPDSALDNALRHTATITTECKGKTLVAVGPSRTRHRRGSSWDAGEAKPGANEDEMELHNIRVQTIQTREVEEVERHTSEGASTDGEGDEWVGSRRGVVVERIV
jgi:hypothetical protein